MKISEHLFNDGILSQDESLSIENFERDKPMSLHWELRSILYLGILLLMSGLSILVYLNLDTIGHQAIIASIALGTGLCFYYGVKHKQPYSHEEVKQATPLFDYIVLLGCLLLGVLIGYLQFQYSVFGLHYGIATLIPAVIYFVMAYFFDHKGILSLGITGFAAWAGITITPMELLENNDFSTLQIIISAMAIGIVLAASSKYTEVKNIKKHFGFTYNNFAANILFIATLAALFDQDLKVVSFIILSGICYYYLRYAIEQQSFFFLLISVIYGYIGLTYAFFSLLIEMNNELSFLLGLFFILASCVGIVLFFIYYKRILKIKK